MTKRIGARVGPTGWAKKVIPLVHYITLYERYHFWAHPVHSKSWGSFRLNSNHWRFIGC